MPHWTNDGQKDTAIPASVVFMLKEVIKHEKEITKLKHINIKI
jgi:hypothetical protein